MLRQLENEGFVWVDISAPTREDMRELGRRFSFHELNLADCVSKIQIPKIDRYKTHVFVILHFPAVAQERVPKPSQLAAFLGLGYLVTVHQEDLKTVTDTFDACERSEGVRKELMGRSAGYLYHSLVDALVDELLNNVRKIMGNMEDIEDAVFDERVAVAREISYLRREVTSLRRIAIPMRRTLAELVAKDVQRFSEEDLTLYYDDVQDHIDKVIETLEESKDTIEIFKDTDFMHSSDRSNKILAVLTIIFTLSMPASIVGSFYGMNVPIPGGTENGPWTFLGPYTAFALIVLASSASAGAMMVYFRRLGWI
ncbi:magnesium transporter CorA family protein [Nitrososphaera viennensis]|uniref:Magnesium transporter CorA family protein n=2 Tax=Nitrososphaera viennensis TaxID=1034015 RepID=A0A977IDU7_9ARCH|nr:magnesium transporter CorA family protein [Nitrososphaera viennensis]AIC14195.1 putative CorA ion transporter [Nitrososphaera viennensis EN76]UVS69196.1 magnesium transporter CorA family protein [Nitrososphaera viennensis]